MGDPAGVGPETVAGAWMNPRLHEICRPLAIGQPEIFRRAFKVLGGGVDVVEVSSPAEVAPSIDKMPVLASGSRDSVEVPPAVIDARGGQAAYDALELAANLALDQQIDGIVTAPLNKAALRAAGHPHPGHTELLAEFCGGCEVAMMLYLPPGDMVAGPAGLGVAHVTLHMAMRDVAATLTVQRIVESAAMADTVMRALSDRDTTNTQSDTSPAPKIAVAAFNPHGGEGGLFGDEELRIIAPAVAEAVGLGIDAHGPLPCDTLMMRARHGEFDGVVAMYHDQGHIALKLLGMHAAVNITLGLPIVRTSVAHGTAFDLAWQGRAETAGMIAAARVAARLALAKRSAGEEPKAAAPSPRRAEGGL